jgi:enamine deaminase RidA (YjgF/YER057c/UK114 family)
MHKIITLDSKTIVVKADTERELSEIIDCISKKDNSIKREIARIDVNEEWSHAGIVEAGDFAFVSYCFGNEGEPIENQINGAIDQLEKRLGNIGLNLESVVNLNCLFKNIMDLPAVKKIFKKRFNGKFPSRKAFQTEFVVEGLLFQLDAIAFKG